VSDCPPIPLALARLPYERASVRCRCDGDVVRWAGGALHGGRIIVVPLCDDCADLFGLGELLPRVQFPATTWMTVHEAAALLRISPHGVSRWALRHQIARRLVHPGDGGGCTSYYDRAQVLAEVQRRVERVPPWRQATVLRRTLGSDWQRWISSSDAARELGVGRRAVMFWAKRTGVPSRNECFGRYGRQAFYDREAVLAEAARRGTGDAKTARMRRVIAARATAAGPEWMPMWEARAALGYKPGDGLRLWAIRNGVPRRPGLIARAQVLAEAARRREGKRCHG
jgi:hypothetical protein